MINYYEIKALETHTSKEGMMTIMMDVASNLHLEEIILHF